MLDKNPTYALDAELGIPPRNSTSTLAAVEARRRISYPSR